MEFGKFGSVVNFDTGNGIAVRVLSEKGSEEASDQGAAYQDESGQWFAFYEESGVLVFQSNLQKWRFDDPHLGCNYVGLGRWGVFVLRRKLNIHLLRRVRNNHPFDPTHDDIDQSHENFFRLLCVRVNSWRGGRVSID